MNNVLHYNRLSNVDGIVASLEQLLADYQVYYTNLRGFHWNVQGCSFFQLHRSFEEMYDTMATRIDDVAERILQLGGTPTARFSDYLKTAKIEEAGTLHCGEACIANVMQTVAYLLDAERAIVRQAAEAGDETTVAFLGDIIREQEKEIWMLSALTTKSDSCEHK